MMHNKSSLKFYPSFIFLLTIQHKPVLCVRSQNVFTKMHAMPFLEIGLPNMEAFGWVGKVAYSVK